MRVLLLNADYSPLDIISWRRAMVMYHGFDTPVYIIEHYKGRYIRDSAGRSHALPAVIALKNYKKVEHKATYNKINVYYRDKFKCQYCGQRLPRTDLTVDHIIPRSRWKAMGNKGSSSCFENIVTACFPCNSKKKDRTPQEAGMVILNAPTPVTRRQVLHNKIIAMSDSIPEQWLPYVESIINVKEAEKV